MDILVGDLLNIISPPSPEDGLITNLDKIKKHFLPRLLRLTSMIN